MPSDHLRSSGHAGHPWGTDAECPGCRETCYCANLTEWPDKPCVACRIRHLGLEP